MVEQSGCNRTRGLVVLIHLQVGTRFAFRLIESQELDIFGALYQSSASNKARAASRLWFQAMMTLVGSEENCFSLGRTTSGRPLSMARRSGKSKSGESVHCGSV